MYNALSPIPGIYIITDGSKRLGKGGIYVGMSKDIYRRWGQHRAALQRGKHHNKHLQKAFTKGTPLRYTIVMESALSELVNNELTVWAAYTAIGAKLWNLVEPGQVAYKRISKPIVATNADGVSMVYPSLAITCTELNLNQGRASCHLRGLPKDKTRKTPAPTVNGYTLCYA